jgi:segregation and condensation protein B
MIQLPQHIESLIFTASEPISLKEIKTCMDAVAGEEIAESDLSSAIESIRQRYTSDDFSFELKEIAGGFRFLTKGTYYPTIGQHLKLTSKKKLSVAAIETLAIIAYKQPVSKSELEQIRGVSCDYAIQKLLEKELVAITGRSESIGKPLLYGTTQQFMDYFGLKSIKELPKTKDFKEPESEVGQEVTVQNN